MAVHRTPTLAALALLAVSPAHALPFHADDLVVSIVGNTDGSRPGDNQASPIQLLELTRSGQVVDSMLLPQASSGRNLAISGEYGSSSEGLLHRSANGQSLVIAGYGIDAATFNAGGAAVYGDARLAQTTSVPGGATPAISRVIANVRVDNSVDTSTALFNAFNLNNPRSVATVDGSTFYVGGQGVKGDTTQGVLVVQDGATTTTPTAVTNASDYRSVSIQNGQLYASRDFNGPNSTQFAEIDTFGAKLPTGPSTPAKLPGLGPTIAATNNGANGGGTQYISPEDFLFVTDPATGNQFLYVADTGRPKNTKSTNGLGAGGLLKFQLSNGSWTFLYDIYLGLGLQPNTAGSGTTGLIGLAGASDGTSVSLFATNATVGDLDQTYLYGVVDPLAQTVQNPAERFTRLYTAAPGTNVRGVAFVPVPEPATLLLVGAGLCAAIGRRRRA